MFKGRNKVLFITLFIMLGVLAGILSAATHAYYSSLPRVYTSDGDAGRIAHIGMRINLLFERLNPNSGGYSGNISYLSGRENEENTTEEVLFDPTTDWGTKANPYIISYPRHMMNLYALQRSGYFYEKYISKNYSEGEYNGGESMPYFLVCDTFGNPVSIDGAGKVINPIGTERYPFIGYVGGAPKTGNAEYNDMSSDSSIIANFVVSSTDNEPDVGLFGKVGYLGSESDYTIIDEENYFEGVVSTITDLLLCDIKVEVRSQSVLERLASHIWGSDANALTEYEEDHHIGILAGHIEYSQITKISVYYTEGENGAATTDAIDVQHAGANYHSDSGIIGFVYNLNPDKSGTTIGSGSGATIAGLISGAGEEWGGSIDMLALHSRLQTILGVAKQNSEELYVNAETITIREDILDGEGNPTISIEQFYGNYVSPGDGAIIRTYRSQDGGSLVFADSSSATTSQRYNLFHGTSEVYFPKTVTTYTYTTETESGFTIGNGAHYLNANRYGILDETNQLDATVWVLDLDGHLSARVETDDEIRPYYLVASGVNLSLTNTKAGATVWARNGSILTYQNGNRNWYLRYNSGWGVYPFQSAFSISRSGTYYVGESGGSVFSVSSGSEQLFSHEGGYLATLIGSSIYYLNARGTDLSFDSSPLTIWTKSASALTHTDQAGNTWKLCLVGGKWRASPLSAAFTISSEAQYLGYTNSAIAKTDLGEALLFALEATGELKIATSQGIRYLNVTNGALTLDASASTTWTKTGNRFTAKDQYLVEWYLTCDEQWRVVRETNYIEITDGENYLCAEGTLLSNGSSALTRWHWDASNHIYTYVGASVYYLQASSSGISLSASVMNAAVFTYDGTNNRLFFRQNGNDYYLIYNGAWTVNRTISGQGRIISVTQGTSNYYLNESGGIISTGTDGAEATIWIYDSVSGKIYVVKNGINYYLRAEAEENNKRSSTNLKIVSNEADGTVFSTNGGQLICTPANVTGATYSLVLDRGALKMVNTAKAYYTIESSSNYLSMQGNSFVNSNIDDAVLWEFSIITAGTNTTVSTLSSGTTRYLTVSRSSWPYTYSLELGSTQNWRWTNYNYLQNRTYSSNYLRYASGAWSVGSSMALSRTPVSFSAATVSLSLVNGHQYYSTYVIGKTETLDLISTQISPDSSVLNILEEDQGCTLGINSKDRQIVLKAVTSEASGYATYFPLVADDTSPFAASAKNTGYVVGGSYASYQSAWGDVRVAYYPMNKLGNSLSGVSTYRNNQGRLEVLTRTFESSGWARVSDSYNSSNTFVSSALSAYSSKEAPADLALQKYDASRDQLHETLDANPTQVYGLHFMDAVISKNHLIVADKVTVNRQVYYNYELPEDCIDFNLKTKGYVNFFAATYYDNAGYENDSFFSLSKIFRNEENKITDIKRILKIYGDPSSEKKPYIYLYADGTYSISGLIDAPNASNGYAGYIELFDLNWIESPGDTNGLVMNAMYYFEIPVNHGEYALGSVSGRYGAYLCYLDIGSSAASTTSTLGSIDFVYDNLSGKIVTVKDSSDIDTSLNYYIPSLTILYTRNNDKDGEEFVKIGQFTINVRRYITSVTDATGTFKVIFAGTDNAHLSIIRQSPNMGDDITDVTGGTNDSS